MTDTTQATDTDIAVEMLECLTAENVGKYLGRDGDDLRIEFKNVLEAASWISNYVTEDGHGAIFEGTPTGWGEKVVVRASIAAYRQLAEM